MAHIDTNFFSSTQFIDTVFDIFIFVSVIVFIAICVYAAGKVTDEKED